MPPADALQLRELVQSGSHPPQERAHNGGAVPDQADRPQRFAASWKNRRSLARGNGLVSRGQTVRVST
jgi:hypothetical protein